MATASAYCELPVTRCAVATTTRLFRIRPSDPQSHPPEWRVRLAPRLLALDFHEPVGAQDNTVDHPRVVDEIIAGQCEIKPAWHCHPVEIEAGRVEGICGVLRGGRHLLAGAILTGGEPELCGRPVEVVLEPVVGVRAAAELGVIVSCHTAMAPLVTYLP